MDTSPEKRLYVSQEDLFTYQYSLSRGEIYKYWLEICRSMPKKLYKELKTKQTTLVKQSKSKFNVDNVTPYVFSTSGASKALQNYLGEFVVLVAGDIIEK